MADTFVPITAGSGTNVHAFTVNSKYRQCAVIGDSVADEVAPVTAANGLDVDVTRVQGSVTVIDGGGALSVDDNGGSLTVDGTVSLGAGSASVGTLGANSGVDIGDVTINNASGASAVNIQDGGNTITVDGTVAATQSGTWNVTNVSGTVSLPTGASTAANQTTAIGLLTTIDADTSALAAAISGTEVQVDVVGALPAGTNNIGDVDVLSVVPGTGATALGKAVDSIAGATDTGVAVLVVRDDSLAALTPADGDYTHLRVNSQGALHVTGAGGGTQYVEDTAHTTGDTGTMLLVVRRDANTTLVGTDGDYAPLQVDANGALKVAGAGTGGTSITDGAVFTPDSTAINPIGGYRDDTSPATVTEGDAAACRITENRALHVNLRDSAGTELTVGGATQYAEDTAHTTGDQMTMAGVVRQDANTSLVGTDLDIAPLQVNATGALKVVLVGTQAGLSVTNEVSVNVLTIAAGDNNIGNVDIVTLPNVTLAAGTNTNEVVGDAAHDAAVAGNPVLIGLEARSTDGTAVTSGDASRVLGTLLGKVVTYPYALPGSTWNYPAAAGGLVNTTGVSAKAAAGAGIRNYVTTCQVINSHQTTGTEILIRDGAAGTVLHRGWAQPAGGGFACTFDPPLRGTANTLIEIAEVTTTATAGVLVNLQGFTAAE